MRMKKTTNSKQVLGLSYDIETSPIISYNWNVWEQNAIEVIEDWQILSVAWHWIIDEPGKKTKLTKVEVVGQDDYENFVPGVNNDIEVVKKLASLIEQADYSIAHNGDRFDMKKLGARVALHRLPPMTPGIQVDTKKMAKRVGGFTYNSLKELSKAFGVTLKGQSGGFSTWTGCLAGDPGAWKKMKRYNVQDIKPMTELYMILRSYDKQNVPMNVLLGIPEACPKCGTIDSMRERTKNKVTKTQSYMYYRCKIKSCGAISQSRASVPTFNKMQYK